MGTLFSDTVYIKYESKLQSCRDVEDDNRNWLETTTTTAVIKWNEKWLTLGSEESNLSSLTAHNIAIDLKV